ncbi:MAG TPA: hypothetical protein VMT86_03975 [Bryobacteraceae bacterium]|nr:hypothetical protein [Bryobacteraceae bacterium]
MSLQGTLSGIRRLAILFLAVLGLTLANASAAATTITFTASGTFAATPISGDDQLKLAGEPFSLSLTATAGAKPEQHGSNWALFTPLSMQGSISSGLIGGVTTISSTQAGIMQTIGSHYDVFQGGFPIEVIGINLTVRALLDLPPGTLTTPLIHPFYPVALGPGNATVTYSNGSLSTTLAVASGTIAASQTPGADAPPSPSAVVLHTGGAMTISNGSDGSQAIRPMSASPVVADGKTVLKLYVSGLPEGATTSAEIAGQAVPVVYAGKSGYFAGLSEVRLLVPQSLAGRGDAEVVLTVHGQTSNALHIQIQ